MNDMDGGSGTRRISVAGVSVRYPTPGSVAASRVARANKGVDTKPEIRLRSALHREGLRFRKDYLLVDGSVRVKVDVAFPKARVAVFVDGCFWHGCPVHQRLPLRNADYWVPKLEANERRDRRVDDALRAAGWHVVRLWEHEDPTDKSKALSALIRSRRARCAW
jgi:DNA mismatch endonuclease (patch repair protein)